MKSKKIKYLVSASLLSLIVGCDSSSEKVDNLPGQQEDNRSTPVTNSPAVNFPQIATSKISENNIESIISIVYSFNHFWLKELIEKIEYADYDVTPIENLVASDYENGSGDFSESCNGEGNAYVDVYTPTLLETTGGIRVGDTGSYYVRSFEQCALEYLNPGYYVSGSSRFDVIEGYGGWEDFYALGTTINESYIDSVTYFSSYHNDDIHSYYSFKNGSRSIELVDENNITVTGELYEEKPYNIHLKDPFKMTNFSIEIERMPGRWSWDSHYHLTSNLSASFSSRDISAAFEIQMIEPVVFDNATSDYLDGAVRLVGDNSVAEITYFDTHIDYRLDSDGDGSFETESMISYSEL